jgi:nicotinate-nucleotide pyrophosphorylase (carboxylating)
MLLSQLLWPAIKVVERTTEATARIMTEQGGKAVFLNWAVVEKIIDNALAEDIGSGDITTNHIFRDAERGSAVFTTREEGVVAGLPVAELVFRRLDPHIKWEQAVAEGSIVAAAEKLALVSGRLPAILSGERVALNFLQRLSGIATKTRAFVDQVAAYEVKILDTRKTTPGLRLLEKYAVKIGGAENHRFGLFDGVLVKDNHIRAAGGITRAVSLLRLSTPAGMKIEVETETLEQVREALAAGADMVMLDNMVPELMIEAVKIIAGKVPVEASGRVTLDTIESVAATGVNFISVGALTHSVQSLDIGLDFT